MDKGKWFVQWKAKRASSWQILFIGNSKGTAELVMQKHQVKFKNYDFQIVYKD